MLYYELSIYKPHRYLFPIVKLYTLQYICDEPFIHASFLRNLFLQWLLRILDDLIAVEKYTQIYQLHELMEK